MANLKDSGKSTQDILIEEVDEALKNLEMGTSNATSEASSTSPSVSSSSGIEGKINEREEVTAVVRRPGREQADRAPVSKVEYNLDGTIKSVAPVRPGDLISESYSLDEGNLTYFSNRVLEELKVSLGLFVRPSDVRRLISRHFSHQYHPERIDELITSVAARINHSVTPDVNAVLNRTSEIVGREVTEEEARPYLIKSKLGVIFDENGLPAGLGAYDRSREGAERLSPERMAQLVARSFVPNISLDGEQKSPQLDQVVENLGQLQKEYASFRAQYDNLQKQLTDSEAAKTALHGEMTKLEQRLQETESKLSNTGERAKNLKLTLEESKLDSTEKIKNLQDTYKDTLRSIVKDLSEHEGAIRRVLQKYPGADSEARAPTLPADAPEGYIYSSSVQNYIFSLTEYLDGLVIRLDSQIGEAARTAEKAAEDKMRAAYEPQLAERAASLEKSEQRNLELLALAEERKAASEKVSGEKKTVETTLNNLHRRYGLFTVQLKGKLEPLLEKLGLTKVKEPKTEDLLLYLSNISQEVNHLQETVKETEALKAEHEKLTTAYSTLETRVGELQTQLQPVEQVKAGYEATIKQISDVVEGYVIQLGLPLETNTEGGNSLDLLLKNIQRLKEAPRKSEAEITERVRTAINHEANVHYVGKLKAGMAKANATLKQSGIEPVDYDRADPGEMLETWALRILTIANHRLGEMREHYHRQINQASADVCSISAAYKEELAEARRERSRPVLKGFISGVLAAATLAGGIYFSALRTPAVPSDFDRLVAVVETRDASGVYKLMEQSFDRKAEREGVNAYGLPNVTMSWPAGYEYPGCAEATGKFFDLVYGGNKGRENYDEIRSKVARLVAEYNELVEIIPICANLNPTMKMLRFGK